MSPAKDSRSIKTLDNIPRPTAGISSPLFSLKVEGAIVNAFSPRFIKNEYEI
jgi:hypothetical protein